MTEQTETERNEAERKEPDCEWCNGYGKMCGFDFYIERIEQQASAEPIVSILEIANYCPNCGRELPEVTSWAR